MGQGGLFCGHPAETSELKSGSGGVQVFIKKGRVKGSLK